MSASRQRWEIFAVVAIGTFMSTLDSSIVNVSLPTISREFAIDLSVAQWIATAYLITVAALLLPVGSLVDLAGRSRAYVGGLILFTLGSLICGAAPDTGALIAARALQAAGATLLMATGAAILIDVWPTAQRGWIMGLMGTVVSLGLLTGPPLGGLISGTLGWRWIFYVNLPVGVLGVALSLGSLRGLPHTGGGLSRFDLPGALGLGSFMVALCLGLTLGPRIGWHQGSTVLLLGASPALLAVFLARQATAAHPMLPLRLFANATFSSAVSSSLFAFTAQFPVLVFLPFYLEGVLGYSEKATGLMIFLVPLSSALLSPLMGRASDRIGTLWPSVVGNALRVGGYACLLRMGLEAARLDVLLPLLLMGVGNAAFGPANQSALMGSVPAANRGIASSIASAVRSLGMVIGAAAGTAIGAAASLAMLGGASHSPLDAAQNPAAFVRGFHASAVFSIIVGAIATAAAALRPNDSEAREDGVSPLIPGV